MCGICGIYSFYRPIADAQIHRMNDTLRHRGPDDEGYLLADTSKGIFREYSGGDTIDALKHKLPHIEARAGFRPNMIFGHRRLSIIDLSDKGHQPMTREGTWIVYNGEIYNYIELRNELKSFGYRFHTESDTEVILVAFLHWGIDCLRRFNGMWAFALWDGENNRLVCSRDRFGIKPFYYMRRHGRFLFASEIKAILASGLVSADTNDQAISHFLLYGTVDYSVETFFKDIYRLNPGEVLVVGQNGDWKTEKWWRLEKRDNPTDLLQEFKATFNDSVRIRLRSDVPVGSCLSGGLDSSYVVSQMSIHCEQVNTFSAVYGTGMRGDESVYIDELVKHTRARKHTVVPTGQALRHDIFDLVYHQEEPFGSTSIFAQWKVMELARDAGVTVLLDGQGADELLSGYHPYVGLYYAILLKRFQWVKWIREFYHCLRTHGAGKIAGYTGYYLLPSRLQHNVRSRASLLQEMYVKKYSPTYPMEVFSDFNEFLRFALEKSLPQLLRYEDKNSMAFSRETRLPFLDYRLVQLIDSMPVGEKIEDGVTKRILRRAMDGMVPDNIIHRYDKVGFETPQDTWFRDEFKSFLDDMFRFPSFNERPYWNGEEVREAFGRYLKGKGSSNPIWRVLSTELWLRQYIDKSVHREAENASGRTMYLSNEAYHA